MKPIVWRFVAMAVLFAGWISYLGFLVATLPPKEVNGLPTILSEPQFLASELDIVGVFDEKDRTLSAAELLYLESEMVAPAEAVSNAGMVGLWTAPVGCGWAPLGAAAIAAPKDIKFRGVTVKTVLYEDDLILRLYPNDPADPKYYPLKPEFVLPVNFGHLKIQNTSEPCIFALRPNPDHLTWDVVPIPPSPGFSMSLPRIYPANAATLAQYHKIQKPPRPNED